MELKEAQAIFLPLQKHQEHWKSRRIPVYFPALFKQIFKKPGRTPGALPYLTAGKTTTIPLTWGSAISTTQSALPPLGTSGARNLMTLPTRKGTLKYCRTHYDGYYSHRAIPYGLSQALSLCYLKHYGSY